jgi:drug/metabolite transporter (DMT)-like permease
VAGSPVAFSAYRYLLTHVTPAVATRYACVNPVIAIFLGAFVAGGRVTSGGWVACGVIFIGIFSILRGKSATLRGK